MTTLTNPTGVADGEVLIGSEDGGVYGFGLKAK
jgi:hypothetical protein